MGSSPSAELVFGYPVCTDEFWFYAEGEDGVPTAAWYDGNSDDSVVEQMIQELYLAIPDDVRPPAERNYEWQGVVEAYYEVEFVSYGDLAARYPWEGTVLALPEQKIRTDCAYADIPDVAALVLTAVNRELHQRFDRVHQALGITPLSRQPRWLVLATYG